MRAGNRAQASVVLLTAALASLFVSAPVQAAPECTVSVERSRVRMETNLGPIEILLCDVDVPVTVDNFLQYVDEGAYTQTGFVHRSVQGGSFIVQGGGFFISGATFVAAVVSRPPIVLELAGLENLRGTIAMARTNAPDSATNQWFINTQDTAFSRGGGILDCVTDNKSDSELLTENDVANNKAGMNNRISVFDFIVVNLTLIQ